VFEAVRPRVAGHGRCGLVGAANQHHTADLQTTIERLTDGLDRATEQLKTAQREMSRFERALDRASRTAAVAQRCRDAQQQRLANFDS
jgi:carbonic anhydrase